MQRIELKTKIFAIVGDDLRTDFDTGKTTATLNYKDENIAADNETSINLIMSQEYIADTLGKRGELTAQDKRQVAMELAYRIFNEQRDIPYNIRSVLALKVYTPLTYTTDIDMRNVQAQ